MAKEARTKPKNARECLCGCGQHPKGDRFFCAGHDRFAETAIMKMFYGSVEALMAKHGFGTNGKNLRKVFSDWKVTDGASAYDATYAILASSLHAPLLTLDNQLNRAAKKSGLNVLIKA